ncbi:MAG TPA: ATP-binding cassette domain-containing protein [Gemmatimonadaceae bacterium]|jgi:simple sugar transport system ATP-binding protein
MIAGAESVDDAALALSHVTKRFGTTLALDDVSFELRRGTVHALLGENGAGKTTLMRVAFGVESADEGTVAVARASTPIRAAADAIAAGVGMVHQHFTNVGAMSVAENVALGGRGKFDANAAATRVREIGARTGLALDPAARAEDLPVGAQQRLEIVKALARDAHVLILDEPTAVLAPSEAEELLRWLRTYAAAGNSVVLITHKLREALSIADDVTVLRRGRVATQGPASGVTAESLTVAMIGASLDSLGRRDASKSVERAGLSVVRARRVSIVDDRGAVVIRDASFEVRGGEVVGIAAVEGEGQRELLRALARRESVLTGELALPTAIGFVPEDRHRDALVLDFDAAENVTLNGAGTRRGRIPWRSVRQRTESLINEFDVRGGGARSAVRALSGGNQQKLVLARELDGDPSLLVVENPTRGLDIRATHDIHERLRAAAARGMAVVMYSSDLDEVLSVADRILVVHAGMVVETERDRDIVGRSMLGVR